MEFLEHRNRRRIIPSYPKRTSVWWKLNPSLRKSDDTKDISTCGGAYFLWFSGWADKEKILQSFNSRYQRRSWTTIKVWNVRRRNCSFEQNRRKRIQERICFGSFWKFKQRLSEKVCRIWKRNVCPRFWNYQIVWKEKRTWDSHLSAKIKNPMPKYSWLFITRNGLQNDWGTWNFGKQFRRRKFNIDNKRIWWKNQKSFTSDEDNFRKGSQQENRSSEVFRRTVKVKKVYRRSHRAHLLKIQKFKESV